MGNIVVKNISKAYKQYSSPLSRLIEWITPFGKQRHSLKWILKDINFTVNSGESVAMIGINGAGKSTLLKMITGTTQPSSGSIKVTGRVAALLELGMGFHPEFTGRQNAYMSGQLLGYSTEEIARLMPEIESFSEIGAYIDSPVRVYSSGMQVRLAFAVATAVRPDIIIIDEALAVGDAAFQRKCFARLEMFRDKGTTLLFVTHDIETVKKICDKALFLENGRIASFGSAKAVCDEYERALFNRADVSITSSEASEQLTYGGGRALIKKVWLEDFDGHDAQVITSGKSFFLKYQVEFLEDLDDLVFAMMIKTREGVSIYGTDSATIENKKLRFSSGEKIVISFALNNYLAPGDYHLNCGIRQDTSETTTFIYRAVDILSFKVARNSTTTVASGIVDMESKIKILDSIDE